MNYAGANVHGDDAELKASTFPPAFSITPTYDLRRQNVLLPGSPQCL